MTTNQKKNILIISPIMPYPLDYGSRIKIYELIKYLASRCHLTLISLCHSMEDVKNAKFIRDLKVEVHPVLNPNKKSFLYRSLFKVINSIVSLLFFIPQDLLYANCLPLRKKIKEVALSKKFDLVHFEYWWTGYFIKYFRRVKSFVLEEDVEFVRYQREYKVTKFGLSKLFAYFRWKNTFRYEIKCCRKFKTILTVTSKDKEILERYISNKEIITSPFLLNIDIGKLPPCDSHNLMFVGGISPHNVDGITYLIKDIFPKIKEEISEVQLFIMGGELDKIFSAYHGQNGIFVLGFVPDIRYYISQCSILVAPLRIGSGIKGKIIEAMMYNRAVVTTNVGAEGIGLTHEKDVLIADTTEEFVSWTVRLLREKKLREDLIKNALRLVKENYSQTGAYKKFFEIYKV
ncbi:glycosyltransferase family 4 protein [bacterium]|nr:glycosyltransferase family 4 protein [bacterium]